jgi:manganese/zinc/iron transport system permease protein
MELLHDLLFDYTLRTVALGTALLGLTSGALGAFAVLRRQSLLGDAVSHAALPGIVLAFMLTGSKELLVLVAGAFAAGWLGSVLVSQITARSRVPGDSALGIVLAVFFGLGLMLLTFVQGRPDAAQAGLDRFLFGQAATLVERDVVVIAALGGVALLTLAAFWKEFKLLSFDPEFGASLGLPIGRIDLLLTSILVLAIVTGLQAVGVVLMAALVVAPAAAARQWTDSLGVMVALSALFGALAGVSGALGSGGAEGVPTGPTIVLAATAIVLASLAFAPRRGLVWAAWRRRGQRGRIRLDTVLADLYALYAQHGSLEYGHAVPVLDAMSDGPGGAARALERLAERGWARQLPDGGWAITAEGLERAEGLLTRLGREDDE